MAAYPDPPPVILLPEYYIAAHIAAQAAYQLRYVQENSVLFLGRPWREMFPGIRALPEPATESSRFSFTSLFIQ